MALKLPLLSKSIDTTQLVPTEIGADWATRFNTAIHAPSNRSNSLGEILVDDVAPWWTDHLSLTWDIRTFDSINKICDLLDYALAEGRLSDLRLQNATVHPTASDNLVYIQGTYDFETDTTLSIAIVKLVLDERTDTWKAWTVFTKLDDLKGHEENRSRLRVDGYTTGDHVDVLVLGAGQSGLQVGAALRTLGLSCLLIEQHARIGDQWRQHYDCLKLHLPKWYAQFAYHHWPAKTPLLPTRNDVADFLEEYAKTTHLNVMTSTTVQSAKYNLDGHWDVVLNFSDSSKVLRFTHIVLATGINGLRPVMPIVPGLALFRGVAMHSSEYKNGQGWDGKKAIVVGCGNSGHDIARDLYNHGASVSMIQRNPTMVTHQALTNAKLGRLYNESIPVERADDLMESTAPPVATLLASIPPKVLNKEVTSAVNEGLIRAGFRLEPPDRSTFVFERSGGHYLNSGTSKLIVDGKIRVKSGIPVKCFTLNGLIFEDSTNLPADLVVFATGYDLHSMRDTAMALLGAEEGKSLKQAWGMDDEGNVRGTYRDSGHPNLWYFGGDFQGARYCESRVGVAAVYEGMLDVLPVSKLLALQVLASKLCMLNRYQGGK
ncbi:FAD/NADP-binding domain-containing protein [Dacryopinax primogenitus]|uniref:FAD/NADP-binding domain-containing protein n=1 Tax=Dacryopinax primogenitus (strain DJM 731) TaxID=1858805 RepID=M5GCI7_DACPD|nr:FAD/NADP-binding domain-containing protein [Dacryopinax primogenitus]EJU03907.1 FAD/NADP-binding domain-containing protein [Dacryopinax primogenitus]